MDLSILYWYIFDENWLDLSLNQRKTVSDIECIIGNCSLDTIFTSLSLGSATGEQIVLCKIPLRDRKKLSVSAIASLRNQFAVKMFKTLFAKNANEEENCQLLSEWCNHDQHEINVLIDNVLGVNQKANRCRDLVGS